MLCGEEALSHRHSFGEYEIRTCQGCGLSQLDPLPATETTLNVYADGYFEGAGEIVRTGGVIFAAEAYNELVNRIETHLREHETITLAQVRDMFSTSRKYAQALLEHLDAKHITRRVGDLRVLR